MKSNHTKQNIITLPNPNLREKSVKVSEINDEVLQLIDDMLAAALDWESSRPHEVAVALAAVQINRLQRVVIIREDFNDKMNQNFTVLINPKIVKFEGEITAEQEGCLSIKDVYGLVPRHSKVRVKALDIDGNEIRFKSPNPFLARVIQHEIDHTNGICFIDHIADQKDVFSVLTDKGELKSISFDKVQEMGILPNEEG